MDRLDVAGFHDKPVTVITSGMIDVTREVIAYAIIAMVLVVGVPTTAMILRRRHRQRLRRRGVKRYGH